MHFSVLEKSIVSGEQCADRVSLLESNPSSSIAQ
ncbi:hypothetical protein CA13_50910 [Planctomycetes bacterium CA13]|uniref:Uncharacterized protein n=1 Tax=Novipirellula herctigrandis TaxID=2527986 RepID=A0A5C5Z8J6_9BACT|nr:hypothetical protein CA13_50910 [Planctomycetes bacterium CA13]